MDEFNTNDPGVVTGDSGENTNPNAGGYGDDQSSADGRGGDGQQKSEPWHKDPRYREFHGEYKNWKEGRSSWQQEQAQYRQLVEAIRGGKDHDLLKSRDEAIHNWWAEQLRAAGVESIMHRHFNGGQPQHGQQQNDPTSMFESKFQTVEQRIAEMERAQRSKELQAEFDSALRQHAAHYAESPETANMIAGLVRDLGRADMDPQGNLRKPLSAYVQEAVNRVDKLVAAKTKAAQNRRMAPATGLPNGLPEGPDRNKALDGEKERLLQLAEQSGF